MKGYMVFFQGKKATVTATESRIFWLSLVICQALWIVFFFGSIFTLNFKWTVSTFCSKILDHRCKQTLAGYLLMGVQVVSVYSNNEPTTEY